MEHGPNPRDLEDRTFEFAQSMRAFVKQLPRTISNTEDVRQLVRASGSVAANWIEADEALSKKDFLMRVKICRKESKESRLFLRLVDVGLAKRNVVARETLAAEARGTADLDSQDIGNTWVSTWVRLCSLDDRPGEIYKRSLACNAFGSCSSSRS